MTVRRDGQRNQSLLDPPKMVVGASLLILESIVLLPGQACGHRMTFRSCRVFVWMSMCRNTLCRPPTSDLVSDYMLLDRGSIEGRSVIHLTLQSKGSGVRRRKGLSLISFVRTSAFQRCPSPSTILINLNTPFSFTLSFFLLPSIAISRSTLTGVTIPVAGVACSAVFYAAQAALFISRIYAQLCSLTTKGITLCASSFSLLQLSSLLPSQGFSCFDKRKEKKKI